MRYLKPVLTAMVVLMILSLNFTTAGAQGGEPDGQVDAAQPVPVFPVDDFTFKKTPIFQFTEDPSAIKYEIKVSNYTTGVLLYTFRGAPNCSPGGICSLAPSYALSPAIQSELKGYYSWVVRSKRVDGSWSPPSAPAGFVVLKKEVTSTFDALDSKWTALSCAWTVTSAGYMKTKGELFEWCNTVEKHLFTSLVPSVGLIYEVKLKRKGESDSPNTLHFLGIPDPLVANMWNKSYEWQVSYGSWTLSKRNNGTLYYIAGDDFDSPYSDWIKLTVWRYGTKIHLWVNGIYLGGFTETSFTYGYMGIGMMEQDTDVSPLLVDSAKVWYSPTPPYPLY